MSEQLDKDREAELNGFAKEYGLKLKLHSSGCYELVEIDSEYPHSIATASGAWGAENLIRKVRRTSSELESAFKSYVSG